jgi:hypothetical protein
MKRISTLFKSIVAAAIVVALFAACKDDEVKPTSATIQGTITIDNANVWDTWKDSGEVQLTIFPAFTLNPPAGWGSVPDDFLGPGVPGGTFAIGAPVNAQDPFVIPYEQGTTSVHYELTVSPGTYSALALGFRHDLVTDPSKKTATLGVHWGNANEVSHGIVIAPFFNEPAPETITVEAGDNVEINFKADFGFVDIWY